MKRDASVFVTGIGVDYESGIFGTTKDAFDTFGSSRVFESPSMENAMTGICIGAAAMGLRPILVHNRNDFMFLGLDPLINLASKWRYMYGGNAGDVPVVIRAIIGRGWGQGATHSQSLQATVAHFPGIAVVMPAMPKDAKGLVLSALRSRSPVVILEHRSLYDIEGEVPEGDYQTPIGSARVANNGSHITVVACSYSVIEALRAAAFLSRFNISVEVLDLISIRPLDEETILSSVRKTGKLLVMDTSWIKFGVASEIAAIVAEKAFEYLTSPIARIGLPNCPAPTSKILEDVFYPSANTLQQTICKILGRSDITENIESELDTFKGPY
jgi:pyruvate/2-oxoglutarate/acetoin dehydrogenase E1 component